MELEQLEARHGDFYAPTFAVRVGGEDLVRDLYMTVSAVTVDLKEKAAGHFSVSISNAFDPTLREFVAKRDGERVDLLDLFAFGSPVEIALGYGEVSKLTPMLRGLVTEISTSFEAGGAPDLSVNGFDALYRLTVGKNTRNWESRRDSDALADVASTRGIASEVEPTNPVKPRIDQNQETDMAFVEKLAERNGATFYMRNDAGADRLYFGPRRSEAGDIVALHWGKGLISFSPEANLARQVTEVQVHGWSAAQGKAIVGRARQGDESGRDARAQSGADRVAVALSDRPVLRVRAPVHTQAEADARALAILEERAQQFVTGSGEVIGLPEVVPDVNVRLDGMGRAFSKTYYVSEATHTVDSSGYATSFKVQETTI